MSPTDNAALGRRIRHERTGKGLTRRELAQAAEIAEGTLARIELYGQLPSLGTLSAIATALDLSTADLLEAAS